MKAQISMGFVGSERKIPSVLLAFLAAFTSICAQANEWVIGNVTIVEDYRAFAADQGILITLANKSYYGGASPALLACTQRFRVVVGQEGMTAEVQKNIFAIALSARLSGDKVRLFVNPSNALSQGYCAVQIGSIGDVVAL